MDALANRRRIPLAETEEMSPEPAVGRYRPPLRSGRTFNGNVLLAQCERQRPTRHKRLAMGDSSCRCGRPAGSLPCCSHGARHVRLCQVPRCFIWEQQCRGGACPADWQDGSGSHCHHAGRVARVCGHALPYGPYGEVGITHLTGFLAWSSDYLGYDVAGQIPKRTT